MIKNGNIILIGFMGCGKTSLGSKLAKAYNLRFLDTDELIENDYGSSITNIFHDKGEKAFREMETALLQRIMKTTKNTVIATGGGMPLIPENAELLKQSGTIVFLRMSNTTAQTRLAGDDSRPLLDEQDFGTKLNSLFLERNPVYETLADYSIETDKKSFYELIKEIGILLDITAI